MHLKTSSAKWRPFCPGGDELNLTLKFQAPAWKDSSPAPANSKKAMPSAAGKNINYEDFQEHDLEPEVDPDLIPTDMDGNFLCVVSGTTGQ